MQQPQAVVSNDLSSPSKVSTSPSAASKQSKGLVFDVSGISFGKSSAGTTVRLESKPSVDFGVNTADVDVGMCKPVVPQLVPQAAPLASRVIISPLVTFSTAVVDTTVSVVTAEPPEEEDREVSVAKRAKHITAHVKLASKPSTVSAPSKEPSSFTFVNKAAKANSGSPTNFSFDPGAFSAKDLCFGLLVIKKSLEPEQAQMSVLEADPSQEDVGAKLQGQVVEATQEVAIEDV
jgi:hypothetical protein